MNTAVPDYKKLFLESQRQLAESRPMLLETKLNLKLAPKQKTLEDLYP